MTTVRADGAVDTLGRLPGRPVAVADGIPPPPPPPPTPVPLLTALSATATFPGTFASERVPTLSALSAALRLSG
jgi:hypothetical protein